MRRSSSTTSRCGASSGSASAASAILVLRFRIHRTSPSTLPARAVGLGDKTQNLVAAAAIDHRCEEVARRLVRVRAETGKRARDPLGLQACELHGELFALRRDEKEAVAAVVRSFLLHHVAFVDELLEDAA